MPHCGLVILAAGGSTRLGRPKQALVYQGQSLLERAVSVATNSVCHPIVVVVSDNVPDDILPRHPAITIVKNPDWSRGIGTSIRTGVARLRDPSPNMRAIAILLCDQPLITPADIDALVGLHNKGPKKIAAAFYADSPGTPAVFDIALIDDLLTLPDGKGGQVIFRRYPEEVAMLAMPQAQADVDTEEDYGRLPL